MAFLNSTSSPRGFCLGLLIITSIVLGWENLGGKLAHGDTTTSATSTPTAPPSPDAASSSAPKTQPEAPPASSSKSSTPEPSSAHQTSNQGTPPAQSPPSSLGGADAPKDPLPRILEGLPQSQASVLGEIIKGCQATSKPMVSTEAEVAASTSPTVCQDGDYQTCLKSCFENTVCNDTCPCLNDCYASCGSYIRCGNWSDKDITTKFNSYIDAASF